MTLLNQWTNPGSTYLTTSCYVRSIFLLFRPLLGVCHTQVRAASSLPQAWLYGNAISMLHVPSLLLPPFIIPALVSLNTFRIQEIQGSLRVCRLHYLHSAVWRRGRNEEQWGFRSDWELLITQTIKIRNSYSQPPNQSRIPSEQRFWQTVGSQLESDSLFQYRAHETAGHNCQRPAVLRERVSALGPVKKGQERSWS